MERAPRSLYRVAVVIGVLVVAVALIGFLRSLWRPLCERGSGRGDSDVANAGGIERFQRQHLAATGKRAHARSSS